MKASALTINQGYYFPLPIRIFGGALPFFALFFLTRENYIMAGLALVMAYLLLTTRYELIIDFADKIYQEHLKILGFKRGETVQFDAIEKAMITKRNQSKTYNSRGSSTTIRVTTFHLLLMIDEERIEIIESESKEKVEQVLRKMKERIGDFLIAEDLT